jgi:hypothetical protein
LWDVQIPPWILYVDAKFHHPKLIHKFWQPTHVEEVELSGMQAPKLVSPIRILEPGPAVHQIEVAAGEMNDRLPLADLLCVVVRGSRQVGLLARDPE